VLQTAAYFCEGVFGY